LIGLGRVRRVAPFLPSAFALGIACLVPAAYAWTLALGSLVPACLGRRAEKLAAPLAAGLIAGEGLMMVLVALLMILGSGWV